MASTRFRSQFHGFSLLLLLTLANLQEIEDSTSSTTKESVQEIQNVGDFEDSVEIHAAPVNASHNFDVVLSYYCRDFRVITLEIISRGTLEMEKVEFRYSFVVAMRTEKTETITVHVTLRDSLVFKSNPALNITTDLHTNNISIIAFILDINPWIAQAGESAKIFASSHLEMRLVSPWLRAEKPGFCFSLFYKYKQDAEDRKIDQCGPLNDIKTFVDFPLAVTGREEGFKKFLPSLYWPDMELVKAHKHSRPRFTISMWVYVMDLCRRTLCSIIHHRSSNFLTPVISFIQSGQLHIQVHYKDGTPFAFLTHAVIPWDTWVQIVVAVDDTRVQVSTRYGENFEQGDVAMHPNFPQGSFHYSDTEGYWVIGGTGGFASFKGFVGPTTIYRLRSVPMEEIPLPARDHPMFAVGLQEYFTHCSGVNARLGDKLEEFTSERLMEEGSINGSCPARLPSIHDWQALLDPAPSTRHQCDVTLSGETPEVDRVVLQLLRNSTANTTSVAGQLYNTATKVMASDVRRVPWALSLLRVSGCLGNAQALYVSAVVHLTGLGVRQEITKGWQHLLVGASRDHVLSQMSLAYHHHIGADGVPKNCDAAAGYYKMAAVTTDKVLQNHNAVHTHSEAVRLDDDEELANHRGSKSDLFQWLSHQALQGFSDAQGIMGEMHYYGKRGFQRDLREAAKFYQMSAEKGNPEGLYNLGISKLKGHGTEKNETEAMELIRKAADQGLGAALNALGFHEVNMRSNHSGAAVYFMRAAKKGDRDGLYNMGVAYDNGWVEGKPRDKKLAFKYFTSAANYAHPGACALVGEELRVGVHLPRHCANSVVYLRFLAEQHPDLGMLLRQGLDAYYSADWYKSLVFYLMAGEAGMEVPQYNAALLCEEYPGELMNQTAVDCTWRYYNSSAEQGWVHSMMKVGDNHWYGKSVPRDTTAAALMYAKAAAKDGHPQALYNLAYMVEYNFSMPAIQWTNGSEGFVQPGNLTFAATIYRRCRDTTSNGNESYLPCALGVVRVTVKEYYNKHPLHVQVLAVTGGMLTTLVVLSVALADDRIV